MSVDEENMVFGTTAPEQASPGEMLKRAREAKKLSHIDIAKQLKLRVQWVVDIENDHYTDASALIYVRGYLRAYARIVDISGESVIAVFDAMKFDEPFIARKAANVASEEQFVMQQPVLSYSKTKSSKGTLKKFWGWFVLILALLVLALVIMWWRSEHTPSNTMQAAVQPQVSLPPIESVPSVSTGKLELENTASKEEVTETQPSAEDEEALPAPESSKRHHHQRG